jgi:hypothetical protein
VPGIEAAEQRAGQPHHLVVGLSDALDALEVVL